MILEDNYTQDITFDNSSRLYVIQNNKYINNLDYFNYKQTAFLTYLEKQASPDIHYSILKGMNTLEEKISSQSLQGILIQTKDKYITLRFNQDGSLAYILISEFDVNTAC